MSVSTSHQISKYYDFYRDKEVVFSKSNIKALKLDPRQIYIKCNGNQWPCIINSSSLQMATIILGVSSGAYAILNQKKDCVISLRYCFFDQDNQPVQFLVSCKLEDMKPFQGSNQLVLVSLNFSQRPPDDLIVRIGEFVEVNQNFNTRKEERIPINKDTVRELNLPKEESYIFISEVPRKCILKDLSFGGSRLMLVGLPKFLENKVIDLRLFFTDTNEKISLRGVVKQADFLPGRQDISIVHIEFVADEIPMTYKFHINSYLTSYQKHLIENQIINRENAKKEEAKVEAMAAAKAAAMQAKMNAQNAINDVKEKAKEKLSEVETKVSNKVSEVETKISNKVSEVNETIKDKISEIKKSGDTKEENSDSVKQSGEEVSK